MEPEIDIVDGAMDRIAASDLNRMALSIEHEVQIKLKEMRIQTVQMYNKLKGERIEERCREVEGEMRERSKKIKKREEMAEGYTKNSLKRKIQDAKNGKLLEILEAAEGKLKKESLSVELLDECVKQVGEKNLGNFLVYALPRDHSMVREYLINNYASQLSKEVKGIEKIITEMIRMMPRDGLGGVIFFSRDGAIVCDNSYRARLEIFRERHLSVIHPKIFR